MLRYRSTIPQNKWCSMADHNTSFVLRVRFCVALRGTLKFTRHVIVGKRTFKTMDIFFVSDVVSHLSSLTSRFLRKVGRVLPI